MNLKELAKASASGEMAERLRAGEPIVIRLSRIVSDDEIEGVLLVNALRTRAGTKVGIRQAPGYRGRDGFSSILKGAGRVPPSRIGDVIAFASAYAEGGVAYVGGATAREHDGLEGRVQVMTAMARASRSKVTKRGAVQYLTITDGNGAVVARSIDDVIEKLRNTGSREWPGGSAGVILRDGQGNAIEFFLGFDRDEAYLAEELEAHGTLGSGAIEVIPAWRIPMSRQQILREIDPRSGQTNGHSGPVTRMFENASIKGQGFVPCLIVACDEDQWAFNSRTGKRHRVVAGLQPVPGRTPVPIERLPTVVRPNLGKSNGVLTLHDAATMDRLAAERAARRSLAAGREFGNSEPPSTQPGLRQGLNSLL